MKRVLVAMSGGVDSACTAYLLLKKGYEVTGVTLKLTPDDSPCQSAKALADYLGIQHLIYDVSEIFKHKIIRRFSGDYFNGLTPNPCVYCNQKIKFGLLFDYMLENGFDYLATGHYVSIANYNNELYVRKSKTFRRDQSYYLYHLTHRQLERILFPLGEIKSKKETLDLYESMGLSAKENPESRGICFTQGMHFAKFLSKDSAAPKTGQVIDLDGNLRGSHNGFYAYTVGQKNLEGINMLKSECVIAVDSQKNLVIIGDESHCYHQKIYIDEFYMRGDYVGHSLDFKIFNWGHWLKGKVIEVTSGGAVIQFEQSVRAIATGQYAVGYFEDKVITGGRIIQILA